MADKSLRTNDGPVGLRRKKSFQGHQYRRKTKPISEQYRAELSKVLGFTIKNNCAFACNEATGNVAFPAGCIIVVCQVRKNRQFHIFNPGHKSITCIDISLDGQNIVTGESGHLPCVRVFSVLEKCQVASFQSHKFGISCVAFAPNSEYIVSVGYQHDNVINVWGWKKNALAASNKVSVKVRAVAFAEDSSYFVTVGNRHVKFWYIEQSKVPENETVPLKGRSGLLGPVRNHLFCDAACGVGSDSAYTYTLSRTGTLCQFNGKRTLENSIQLQATAAYCMHASNGTIVCGCGDGKVLLHSSNDLQLLSSFVSSVQETSLSDLLAVSMDSKNMWVHCVHSDHTIRTWDLIDLNCPTEHSSRSFHSDCVWDIKEVYRGEKRTPSFYTCSNDATVKLWEITDSDYELCSNLVINTGSQASTPLNPKTGKAGIRSLCVSEDSNFLAVGDRSGVIHIYETGISEHKRTAQVDMHSGDILSLAFNASNRMLASASRDRCIYILDAERTPTYTINDHSAAVTAVEFVYLKNKLRLISCGVDKSLYFCTVEDVDGRVEVVRDQHIVEKHAMHDMTIVNDSVLVACGANLREYDIDTGKSQRFVRGSESLATIIRTTTDRDHTIIAISCADKFVYILNYQSGECLLELAGHSEVCTAMAFICTAAETTLVTASADSCVFGWKFSKCAKVDDAGTPFRSQLSPHVENGREDQIPEEDAANDVNTTAFFGDPTLNGSLVVTGSPLDDLLNGSKQEDPNGEMSADDTLDGAAVSGNIMDLDTSLPTWLTGKKDKVIRTKAPAGKWASRFQDQYKDVVILDTPRTVMQWEDVDGGDSSSGNVTDEALEEETPEMGAGNDDEEGGEKDPQTDADAKNETTVLGDTSTTLSTDYASAVDESDDEKKRDTLPRGENPEVVTAEANGGKVEESRDAGDRGELGKEEKQNTDRDVTNDAPLEPAIPPAFADLIETLSKKKPRTHPQTLPVRSSYGYKRSEKAKNPTEIANFYPATVIPNPQDAEMTPSLAESQEELHAEAVVSSDECQEVVGNLMSAYEQAESMYHRVSEDNRSKEFDARALLSNAFISLKDRIDQLQIKIAGERNEEKMNIDNLPPVLTLLREYSDKLCSMVTEEIRKNSVLKE